MAPILTEIASDLAFPEGPVMLPDGMMLVVEIAKGCVTRIGPNGRKTIVATPGGGPNGGIHLVIRAREVRGNVGWETSVGKQRQRNVGGVTTTTKHAVR